ncbi:tRNA (N(6)-L-threonylcarbamoyladenosine(37)-C(2))-methylthiotransferase MtaB [soil metagenome]
MLHEDTPHIPRVAITTLGCKLNYAESSALREQFIRDGYRVVNFGEEADVVVVNTCTVTERADTECRTLVRRSLRTSPNARIAITGCYAQLQPERIASIEGVSLVVGQSSKQHIPSLVKMVDPSGAPRIVVDEFDDDVPFTMARSTDSDTRTRAFLKIQDGCDYTCSFCTIPLARGPGRSLPISQLLSEVDALELEGYQEVVLTGVNVGEYSTPNGDRFIDVIRALDRRAPGFRIRVSSIEPNTLRTDVIEAIASSDVFCKHVHVPLQSGSASVLQAMKRRYNPSMYRATIDAVRAAMPSACIGIDVIVGFPGESDEHFEESYRFLESLPFSYLHVFTYSERENTPAAAYGGRVAQNVRHARTARLRSLSEERRAAFQYAHAHTEQVVIPEAFDAERRIYPGWTSNYVRVAISSEHPLLHVPYVVQLGDAKDSFMNATVIRPLQTNRTSTHPFHIPIATS